jgi:hypothetical protein
MPTETMTSTLFSLKPGTRVAASCAALRRLFAHLPLLTALLLAVGLTLSSPAWAQSTPVAKLSGTGYETTVYASTLSAPYAVATDASGNIYYSDFATHAVYRETPGPSGFTQIKVASFGNDTPSAIAVDGFNDVFVVVPTDEPNGGSVYGVVYEESYVEYCSSSSCTPGWNQSVIPTTGLLAPLGIAVAIDNKTWDANFIFIADTGNNRIVQLFDQLPGGSYSQSTLPFSGLSGPQGIAVDAGLDLFIADTGNNRVIEEAYSLNGPSYSQKAVAAGLSQPAAVAVNSGAGIVAVADTGNKRVLVEQFTGSGFTQSVVPTPGATPTPNGVAINTNGQIVVAEVNPQQVVEEQFAPAQVNFGQVNVGSTSATAALVFTFSEGGAIGTPVVTTEGASGLDFYNTKTGSCNKGVTFATGATCTINVTFSPKSSGALYGAATLTNSSGAPIANAYFQGVGEAPSIAFLPSAASTVGSGLSSPDGIAVDTKGDVFISEKSANKVIELPAGSSTPVVIGSGLSSPADLALDGAGAVYILDSGNHRVVKEAPTSSGYAQSVVFTETTVTSGGVTTTTSPYSMTADGAGNVFMVVSVTKGSTTSHNIYRSLLQTNGSYTTAAVTFKVSTTVVNSGAIAVDAADNLYTSGGSNVNRLGFLGGAEYNYTSVVPAEQKYTAEGIAVDGNGNLYYTTLNGADGSRELVMATPTGNTYTLSTLATDLPEQTGVDQIAVDSLGDVYLAATPQTSIGVEEFSVPGTLNFGNIEQLSMSGAGNLTVENIGNQELTFSGLEFSPNPYINGTYVAESSGPTGCQETLPGGTPGTVAAGTFCQISIFFEPQKIGSAPGDVVFIDNNLNGASAQQSVPLLGNGIIDTPVITWPTPAPIIKGTALSATQLDATATFNGNNVAGIFAYSPAAGTILPVGSNTLSVKFSPTDKTDYTTATASVTLVVNQPPQPTITWPTPAAITYGTALTATQLNAAATYNSKTVAGTFAYTPALGAILNAGSQTLSVTFTPANLAAYSTTKSTVTLQVNTVPLIVVADSFSRTYGAKNPTFTASYIGLVNGDTQATAVTGAPVISTVATPQFPWGIYDIAISQGTLASTNYTFSMFVPGTLFISQAPLTISANNITVGQGGAIPALTYSPAGFVEGDTAAVLSGAPTETTTATATSAPGSYPISIGQGTLSALNYTFTFVPGTVTVTTAPAKSPTFSHPAGTYATEQKVTISDATPGATIYYTTDGEKPTTSSSKYTDAITVSSTETVMAIAIAPSHKPSAVAEVKYTIQ